MKKVDYNKALQRLTITLGRDMALFCVCAVADLPYVPDTEVENFDGYISFVESEAQGSTFEEGDIDVSDVLRQGMSDEERWFHDWGVGDSANPYTEKQYRQLDDFYKTMTAQLDDLGALTKQQEDTARTCAIWALQRAEKSAKGDRDSIEIAAKLDKLIRDNLADCNMRSRDILPSQQQRPDGFVDALKKKYGLTAEMTKDEVLEAFYNWCKERNYPQTVDAEEKALLAIIQTIQKNNDLPVDQELPEELELGEFGFEFSTEPNEDEKATYDYLGLVRGGDA